MIGNFNARHKHFGDNDNNKLRKSLISLINQGKLIHMGPYFPTYTPTLLQFHKIFSNKHHYLNYITEPGEITTSDHITIILGLSTNHS